MLQSTYSHLRGYPDVMLNQSGVCNKYELTCIKVYRYIQAGFQLILGLAIIYVLSSCSAQISVEHLIPNSCIYFSFFDDIFYL